MIRLWLLLRRLRRHATPSSTERGMVEAYLQQNGALSPGFMRMSWIRPLAIVTTIVLVFSVSVSSYAYASDTVLPDTVLYPVREAVEHVEKRFAVTPARKERVHQKLLDRRMREEVRMRELNRPIPRRGEVRGVRIPQNERMGERMR